MNRIAFKISLLICFTIFLISNINLNAQNNLPVHEKAYQMLERKGEVYFSFVISNKTILNKLSKIISIDNVKENTVFAYANKDEFEKFLTYQIDYTVLKHPGDVENPVMKDNIKIKEINDWDFYPTYNAYEDMMNQFATNYPNLCQLVNIGTLPSGRKLLAAKISKNVNIREAEPQFFYSSSMHGDETTGYVLMLRLIDYLLTQYGVNSKITNLLDHAEIWINPLANPDGTYRSGNTTVSGATRSNANNVDLNRNFPDPDDGPHPDGYAWQPETQFFMQFAYNHSFNMSANFHGGAEVVNYPWDTWSRLTADNAWWVYQSRKYADTVHANAVTGYMDGFDNGITNGYAWYEVTGGRQDYINYYHKCREVTIELSDIKLLPASQLPAHWNYNYNSLINYMQQTLYGIHGIVVDSITNQPLKAMVFINGYDQVQDSSMVFTSLPHGNYHRYVLSGTYNITFSAPGYHPKTIYNVSVTNGVKTLLDTVKLRPGVFAEFTASNTTVLPNTPINFYDNSSGNPTSWHWIFNGANITSSTQQNPTGITYANVGTYPVTLTVSNGIESHTITKTNYINVQSSINILMSNGTTTTCGATFYDTGGSTGNYTAYQNLTHTFLPETAGKHIKAVFTAFQTESDYDYLYIYNGTSTTAPQIAGSPFSGSNGPGTVIATNPNGALTFKFTSDSNINGAGWAANIMCIGVPVANFYASLDSVEAGSAMQFFDISENQPDHWLWTFAGGTPSTSTLQNPLITYQTAGVYNVTLTASNSLGSDTETKIAYVKVYNPVSSNQIISKENQVLIFPNPSKGLIYFQSNFAIEEIKIYTLQGKEVMAYKNYDIAQPMNISQLTKGIYIANIKFRGISAVNKLVVVE